MASRITVRVLKPKKSIFKRPNSSSSIILNWVVITSLFLESGTYLVTSSFDIRTPAAWVEECRGSPSTFIAKLISLFTFVSLSYSSFSSLFTSKAELIVIPIDMGIFLAMKSTSPYGILRALPTSLMEPLAAMVPNVII